MAEPTTSRIYKEDTLTYATPKKANEERENV